jgi:hypothetical protein
MLESESKLVNRPTQTGGKMYDKFYVYIPREVSKDSAFPFKANQKLKVRIDVENRRLVIEKLE